MTYLGEVIFGAIFDLKFTTVQSTGAPTTLAGTPAISVYKDNSTTQTTTGVTLTVDFDSVTGLNNVRIDTSGDASFYAQGSNFQVVITTGTVNSVSAVGYVVGQFSIAARSVPHLLVRTTIATLASQTSFTLTAGSADNDAYNGSIIIIQDASTAVQKAVGVVGDYTGSTKTITMQTDPAIFTMATGDYVTIVASRALKPTVDNRYLDVSTGGEGGVDWANVGSPTTTNNLSGTSTKAVEPTVAGRTLDVSAGGEAGVDWANVGSPTTTLNLSGTSTLALEPTTAGRKLDVSTGGEAGLDWANIGSPTTAQNLSATNIDVDQIVASVSGAVGSVTGAVGSVTGAVGSVTGAVGSVTGAVGSVTGAVGSVTGAVGSVTGNVGGNVTGTVASVVGNVGGNVTGNVTGSVGSLATQAKADVNAEVLTVLNVTTFPEPTGVPAATATLSSKIGRLHQALRNQVDVTSTKKTFYDDAAAALWEKDLSDNGTTFSESEGNAP